jgi:hypothetical protein
MAYAGRAQQSMGAGIGSLASGLSAYARQQGAETDRLSEGRAKSYRLIEESRLEEEMLKDTNPDGFSERWSPKVQDVVRKSEEAISDPKQRELYRIQQAPILEDRLRKVRAREQALTQDREVATSNEALTELGRLYNETPDEATKREIIDGGTAIIDGMHQRGFIDNEAARKAREGWVVNRAVDWANRLSPAEKVANFGGFAGALKVSESSGNPRVVNGLGYAGLYQFGAPRLESIGVYRPGSDEDMARWSKTGKLEPGKWSGTFNIPGHPEVRTLQDFLNNKAAQETAFAMHTAKMDDEIKQYGLDRYIGQKVQGFTVTRDALHGMIHLGGVGGAKQALEGRGNAADANGTSVLAYGAKFAKAGGSSGMARFVPEDKKLQLADQGEREFMAEKRAEAAALHAQRTAEIETRVEQYDRLMIEAKRDPELLPPREALESDPILRQDPAKQNDLLRAYDKANEEVTATQRAVRSYEAGEYANNPLDKKVQDGVERVFQLRVPDAAAVVDDGEEASAAKVKTLDIVKRTAVIPEGVANVVRGSSMSKDPKLVERAMTLADQIDRENPETFRRTMGDAMSDRLATWRENATLPVQERIDLLQRLSDPAQVKAREMAREQARKLLKDSPIADSVITDHFDTATSWEPSLPDAPMVKWALRAEFETIVEREYARTGDMKLAQQNALKELSQFWGVTEVDGKRELMKFPPELYYPPGPDGSHAWMKEQAKAAILSRKTTSGATVKGFDLVADADTEAQVAQWRAMPDKSKAPQISYQVVMQDENGVWSPAPRMRDGRVNRFFFDPRQTVQQSNQVFERQRETVLQTEQDITRKVQEGA